jgi:hypothetical protein
VRRLGKKVTQFKEAGHDVTIMVPATYANISGTVSWTTQWNRKGANPRFTEVCSCHVCPSKEVHHRFHIMTTRNQEWPVCKEVPGPRPGHRGKTQSTADLLYHLVGLAGKQPNNSISNINANTSKEQGSREVTTHPDPVRVTGKPSDHTEQGALQEVRQLAYPTEQREQAKIRWDDLKVEGK